MFVPLMFGDLAFGVDALAFQKLTLTRNFSVAKHTRIGTQPTLQFTGRDGVSVELPCALFPARIIAEPTTSDGAATVVGFEALDALRDMAARGAKSSQSTCGTEFEKLTGTEKFYVSKAE